MSHNGQMKVLLLRDRDYLDAVAALEAAHRCAQTQVWLCEAFKRENGIHFHSYAYWRLQRRKYARLLSVAIQN